MRCEDCLPLIEEYFDKELDARTGEQMSAHLSTCADCAAALDSLSFEQEIYARYDRPVEVAPSLWASVSAEIARDLGAHRGPERRRDFYRAVVTRVNLLLEGERVERGGAIGAGREVRAHLLTGARVQFFVEVLFNQREAIFTSH